MSVQTLLDIHHHITNKIDFATSQARRYGYINGVFTEFEPEYLDAESDTYDLGTIICHMMDAIHKDTKFVVVTEGQKVTVTKNAVIVDGPVRYVYPAF